MKLELKIFLAALRERRELDAILPDLLSAMDFDVLVKPGVGVRQFGVDIAAVGVDEDEIRKMFLFVVKEGNLTRQNWDTGPTAVRQSVNEARDFYVPNCITAEYVGLPVVIVICVGGEIEQAQSATVATYTRQNSTDAVSIITWDGDRLAGLISRNMLREELLPKADQAHFRKALAMVDTPDISVRYFRSVVDGMFAEPPTNIQSFEKAIGRLNVCLQVLFVWARDGNNLDAPFQAGEYAVLRAWSAASGWTVGEVPGKRRAFTALRSLHRSVGQIFKAYVDKLSPAFEELYALSARVRSHEYVDVNLKAFDLLGRVALTGFWLFQFLTEAADTDVEAQEALSNDVLAIRDSLTALLDNNPVLKAPMLDRQAIDVVLACSFLFSQGARNVVGQWLPEMASRLVFAYRTHDKYLTYHDNYRTLLLHPAERTEKYRKDATDASSLLPTLACWLKILGDEGTVADFGHFAEEELKHCNFQLWLPRANSEDFFWQADGKTGGATLTNLSIIADGAQPIGIVIEEVSQHDELDTISAMRHNMPALVLTACRHFKIPVPPQFWAGLYQAADVSNSTGVPSLTENPASSD